jgi:hypothetical protein
MIIIKIKQYANIINCKTVHPINCISDQSIT